jgi:hypothetical protein
MFASASASASASPSASACRRDVGGPDVASASAAHLRWTVLQLWEGSTAALLSLNSKEGSA